MEKEKGAEIKNKAKGLPKGMSEEESKGLYAELESRAAGIRGLIKGNLKRFTPGSDNNSH